MRTMWRVLGAIALISLGGCRTAEEKTVVKDAPSSSVQADAPSTHGMLVVGNGPVYLSHLPMFHKPHDYQVLLEVDFVKAGADPVGHYAQDRHQTGEKVYTVVPELFSLPELFSGQRTSFKATLFRGHFERGGSPIIEGVTVKVKRVIMAQKFAPNPVPLPSLKYFLFGNEAELFAAHVVNKKPDFDHVESVKVTSGVVTEAVAKQIRAGAFVEFPGVANVPAQALKVGLEYQGQMKMGVETLNLKVQVGEDFYLETGDLSF